MVLGTLPMEWKDHHREMDVSSLGSYSVIIPTFNRKNLLKEAIDSALKQTQPPLEIIVVDDGSSDGTHEMLEDMPVKVICQENAGPSAARNRGSKEAKGKWLAFLDSDDMWKEEKLKKQMLFAEGNPEIRLIHTEEDWIRNGKPLKQKSYHQKEGGRIYRRSLGLCLISPSSVLIDREFFLSSGGFDEKLLAAEDYDLWLRICHRHPVGFVDEALTIKRGGHSDQLSAQPGIDRYRVLALEKMLSREDLKGQDRALTVENLVERYRRLAIGYRKHGKKEATHFEDRLAYWRERV